MRREEQTQSSSSSSSSTNSSNRYPPRPPSCSSFMRLSTSGCRNNSSKRRDFSTDLSLALSISHPLLSSNSTTREETLDWPPIKSALRSKNSQLSQRSTLFVKVYMEGIPIGRKLNLLAHHSYDGLVRALNHMFKTIILCPNSQNLHSGNLHVLTYEDQEGDWMMVGDVPWEMFLTNVKRLKITRADRC